MQMTPAVQAKIRAAIKDEGGDFTGTGGVLARVTWTPEKRKGWRGTFWAG